MVGVISRHQPATLAAMAAELGVSYDALVPVVLELVKASELSSRESASGVCWVAAA